ncbi:MAG: aldo/keto reductase [Acidimicrobiia bacterium]
MPQTRMPVPVPNVTLNNGVQMPQLGFGVFLVPPAETTAAVDAALQAGYRSIDTAAVYGNEVGVGRSLADSGLARDELFVTTKLWNDDQGYDSAFTGLDASLDKLGLDYVDLYLVHWPAPAQNRYVETWRAFEKVYADGRARAVGVSNFQPAHLQRLLGESDLVPAVNQIELHPWLPQGELRSVHAERGIATEAWSPLAKGGDLLHDGAIIAIADRLDVSAAQVVLRWHLQLGNVVIPKSVTPARIKENIRVFDFELTAADMVAIAALESGTRTGPDPDTFG